MNFASLALSEELLSSLSDLNFTTPTPIQAEAIPVALTGRDLIACAQTGTGKTLAFALPLLMNLQKDPESMALILAPTRELAQQIIGVFRDLMPERRDIRSALIIGGVAMHGQNRSLRQKPRLIVATPGRLCDHLRMGTIRLDKVKSLVLDEADRMLDMGFAPQLKEILRQMPEERQTLLFSATLPREIQEMARKILKDPTRVSVGEVSRPNAKISHYTVNVEQGKKNDKLLEEVGARQGLVLIFARTKHRADRVARFLDSYDCPVERIHGDRSQAQRQKALEEFRSGNARILVATDIAARGIDIPEIELVINLDLPDCPEDYIHRIGRTARAGLTGEAMAILAPEDRGQWKRIQKLLGDKVENKAPAKKAAPAPVAKVETGNEILEGAALSVEEESTQVMAESQEEGLMEERPKVRRPERSTEGDRRERSERRPSFKGRGGFGRDSSRGGERRNNSFGGGRPNRWEDRGERAERGERSNDRGYGRDSSRSGERSFGRSDTRDGFKRGPRREDRGERSFGRDSNRSGERQGFGRGNRDRSETRGSFDRRPQEDRPFSPRFGERSERRPFRGGSSSDRGEKRFGDSRPKRSFGGFGGGDRRPSSSRPEMSSGHRRFRKDREAPQGEPLI